MNGPAAFAVCCVAIASTSANAVQMTLDRRAIEEAVFIGQSRIDAERNRFHASYRLSVASPPVDWIDVITPFHRVELAAETNARAGRRQFGQREALDLLREAPSQIDLLVELTFHPLNTFIGVPPYQVALVGPEGTRLPPRRLDRVPRYTPRLSPSWPALVTPNSAVLGGGDPVLGGTLIAAFDGSGLNPEGRYKVLVLEGDAQITEVELDLARMR